MTKIYEPNRIRELREDRGWSQEELADKIGATAATVGKQERRERQLTIKWQTRYAKVFGVTKTEIIEASSDGHSEMESELLTFLGDWLRKHDLSPSRVARLLNDAARRLGPKPNGQQ